MRQVKEILSPTRKRKLLLYERDEGRFCFEEIYEDFDEHAGTYWSPGHQSGIFDSVASAETEMRAITPWLRGLREQS